MLALEVESNRTGDVISQSPAAGALIPRGSLVLLYVGAPTDAGYFGAGSSL